MPREDPLVLATLRVVGELHAIHEQLAAINNNNAILNRMAEMEKKIMSAISDYTEAVDTKFGEIGTSVEEIIAAIAGVSGDVASLKSIIEKLENNPGPISPEDQVLLTNGLAKVTALSDKLKGVSASLKALDAATETAPTAPPE